MTTHARQQPTLISSGIVQLDDVLGGGLRPNRVYLLHGNPGAGKTTLALQFLLEGVRNGERVLYITLSETRQELLSVAESHGFSAEGIDIFELIAQERDLDPDSQYTMYHPSEIELTVTAKAILDEIARVSPRRVIIDSLSEIKLIAQSPLRFRRQVLALKQFFTGRDCTVFFLDDKTTLGIDDLQVESIAHGVISLEQLSPEFGAERRRLKITKLRGQKYRGGYHDFNIIRGGLEVYPRIVASEHGERALDGLALSGIAELDTLLGGGLNWGTSSLLLGPAGVGKSSVAFQYAVEAARRGQRSIVFSFDERIETMLQRADGIGIGLRQGMKDGLIEIRTVDPAELSPGEFAHRVRQAAEGVGEDGKQRTPVRIVVIDSLNGYLNAMPEEHFLTAQLHELLTYLGNLGIVTFLVVAQYGLLGQAMTSAIDTSYLADNVILFRYFETNGEVRQLISVVKKRSGQHERTLREFRITSEGLTIGEPLHSFQGVLSGTPYRVDLASHS
jgi:circadian clock protein KaiC